jgi:PAS domain S-box-containing protein
LTSRNPVSGARGPDFSPAPVDFSRAVSVSTVGTAGIAAVTLIILALALLTSWVDRRFAAQSLELAESDERYRRLFERSLAGVYRVTVEGRILDCNDACSRILGYASRKEQLCQTGEIIPLYSDGSDGFLAALKEQKALSNFERCLRRKDSSPVWVLENATLPDLQETALPEIEGTLIDITERKRTETELRQANSQLELRQREIEEDLQLAARVQQSLVPASVTWGGLSVETFYQPARTIGGDFGLVAERADGLNIPLQPGDRVVIYTDGFVESFNVKEEMLGIEGFAGIVQSAASLPLPSMKQAIVEKVAAWRSGPPTDDMSLVIVGVL